MPSVIDALKLERDKARRDFERIDPKDGSLRDRRAYLHGIYHGLVKAIRHIQARQPVNLKGSG